MIIGTAQAIPDVVLYQSESFDDKRGFFQERFKIGGSVPPVIQINHSFSHKGVFRGLHYQLAPKAMGKYVFVASGLIWDCIVDLRKGSPWYLKSMTVSLFDTALWVPPGFAHGFLALEDSNVIYGCTETYDKELDRAIFVGDPLLNIAKPGDWGEWIMSDKDKNAPLLKAVEEELNFYYVRP